MKDRPYGDICRELVRRICYEQRISRVELTRRLKLHPQAMASRAYRGSLSLERAVELARLGSASPLELAEMERAWLAEHVRRDRRAPLQRANALLQEYRKEIHLMEDFLRERNLWHEYVSTRRRFDPDLGLINEPGEAPGLQAGTRDRRRRRPVS